MKHKYPILAILSVVFFLGTSAFSETRNTTPETGTADTLVIKTGECKPLELNIEGIDALLWNTGNQDIAVPEAVFGNVKICGTGEGVTYISGSSANSERQLRIIVKVVPGPTTEKFTKTVLPAFRETVDIDVEKTLNIIMSNKPGGNYQSKMKVSENNRYLVEENTGKPFLFLSQTLWSITRRLSREDVVKALDICKEQGFTAVQLLAHSHYMGPNVYGSAPFENENFLRPVLSAGNRLQVQGEYD